MPCLLQLCVFIFLLFKKLFPGSALFLSIKLTIKISFSLHLNFFGIFKSKMGTP